MKTEKIVIIPDVPVIAQEPITLKIEVVSVPPPKAGIPFSQTVSEWSV